MPSYKSGVVVLLLALFGSVPAVQAVSEGQPEELLPMYLSAGELLNNCAASSLTSLGRERRRFCAGFVSGVEESMRLAQMRGGDAGADRICPSPKVSARQLAESYVRYANQNRSELTRPAADLVAEALRHTYSCRKVSPP